MINHQGNCVAVSNAEAPKRCLAFVDTGFLYLGQNCQHVSMVLSLVPPKPQIFAFPHGLKNTSGTAALEW